MSTNTKVIEVTELDREYFRQKYVWTMKHNPAAAEKVRKQLEMIEDSLVIYKLIRTPEICQNNNII